ncbi:hypothetical protein H8D30_00835 [bacterium]|nr:hypothetical protein [bacterium]
MSTPSTYAIFGNIDVAKSLVAEALVHRAGATTRLGNLQDGSSHFATHSEEKNRGMSLFLSTASFSHDGVDHQIIDTPGFPDFVCDRIAGLAAADAAILVVDGGAGADMATRRALAQARAFGLPVLVVVNKMDGKEAETDAWVGLRGAHPIQETESGAGFSEPTSLLDGKDLPEDLLDAIVEQDDDLMDSYLEGTLPSREQLEPAMKKGVLSGDILPVLYLSALNEVGVDALFHAISSFLPGTKDSPFARRADLLGSSTQALHIFKTKYEGQMGEVQFARVASGGISKGDTLKNNRSGDSERISQIYKVFGAQRTPLDRAEAGQIIALVKLKSTQTGDSLSSAPVSFPPIPFPDPTARESLSATEERDEEKVNEALRSLLREEPAVNFGFHEEVSQNIIDCFGETQLSVLLARLSSDFGLSGSAAPPRIPYRETFQGAVSSHYRHKKQSGGRGQFGECHLRLEPLPRGEGFTFEDEIVGGKIPAKFIASVEKGVREAIEAGSLLGSPVVDLLVAVHDGKTHDVDSSDIAFQIAGRQCFREMEKKGTKLLLEPFGLVEVIVPEGLTGEVIGDLNSRRGRVEGMEPGEELGTSVIRAQVPLKEMYKYDNALRSIAKGDGTFSVTPSTYEQVPPDLATKLIATAQKETE